jgi:hypothetical protein
MGISSILVIFIVFISNWAISATLDPNASVSDGHVYITTPTGKKQVISVNDSISEADVKFVDLTFSNKKDLMILKERGANQEFYNVYIYSKDRDEFVFNKRLSDIPCLSVDSDKKQLIGACFHEDACENWEEHYSVNSKGVASLIERRGTYCDPTGQAYSYIDTFKKGRRISSHVTPLKN